LSLREVNLSKAFEDWDSSIPVPTDWARSSDVSPYTSLAETASQPSFKLHLSQATNTSEPHSSASSTLSVEKQSSDTATGKSSVVSTHPAPKIQAQSITHKPIPRANPTLPDVEEEPSLESCLDLHHMVPSAVPTKVERTGRSEKVPTRLKHEPTRGTTPAISTRSSIGKALLETLRLQQPSQVKDKRKSMTKGGNLKGKAHSRNPSFASIAKNSYGMVFFIYQAVLTLPGVTTTVTASSIITSAEPAKNKHTSMEITTTTMTTTILSNPEPKVLPLSSTPRVSSLLEAHAIPSLNFSSINLLGKLNDALELRRASFGGDITLHIDKDDANPAFRNEETTTPPDLDPVEEDERAKIREKYKSLFMGLDDIDLPDAAEAAFTAHATRPEVQEEEDEYDGSNNRPSSSDTTRIPTFRPLSPVEILEEVRRISVPSVSALTQRLSEILPNLRRQIRDDNSKPDLDQEIANETHSAAQTVDVEYGDVIRVSNKIVDGRRSVETAKGISPSIHPSKGITENHTLPTSFSASRQYPLPTEGISFGGLDVDVPIPRLASGRLRSFSDGDADWAISERASKFAIASRRSLNTLRDVVGGFPNGLDARPWNLDSSYPWSNSIPFMDIRFPVLSQKGTAGFSASPKSPLSRAVSPRSSESSGSAFIVPPIAIAPNSAMISASNSVPASTLSSRRQSLSTGNRILNTISLHRKATAVPRHSRRNSYSTNHPASTVCVPNNGNESERPPVRPGYESSHGGSLSAVLDMAKPVDPGDRYPTSALGAPSQAVLGWDEVRSVFSEDSGEDGYHLHSGQHKRRYARSGVGSSKRGTRGSIRTRLGKAKWMQNTKKGKDTANPEFRLRHPFESEEAIEPDEEPTVTFHHEIKAKRLVTRLKTLL
jgi:hypothetical protein